MEDGRLGARDLPPRRGAYLRRQRGDFCRERKLHRLAQSTRSDTATTEEMLHRKAWRTGDWADVTCRRDVARTYADSAEIKKNWLLRKGMA